MVLFYAIGTLFVMNIFNNLRNIIYMETHISNHIFKGTRLRLESLAWLEEISKFLKYPKNNLEKPSQLIWNNPVIY